VKGVLVAVLLLAGCDRLFALQHVSATRDADVDDAFGFDGAGTDAALDATRGDAMSDALIPFDASPPGVCPADYGVFGGLVIRLSDTSATWADAMDDCVDDRGTSTSYTHLIVFTNDVQRGNIGSITGNAFWIGYTDRAIEGTYQWVTAQPNMYPGVGDDPWAGSEPSVDSADDNCVVQRGVDDWDNVECTSNQIPFMCQCDAYPPDSSRY
jgi:hypothetical protein